MGQEISRTTFTDDDRQRFALALQAETALARQWFEAGRFAEDGLTVGCELEGWLLDRNRFPKASNQRILAALDDPMVVPELSRFNIELNASPRALAGTALSDMEAELRAIWARCDDAARDDGGNVVAIGTLPTLKEADLSLSAMTPSSRYRALNEQVLRARGGAPITLDIDGIGSLHTAHENVMLEAATTSFQLHLQVPACAISRYLNASTVLSGPIVALSANAPFLFGQPLWHETRIPLFEQAVNCGDGPSGQRVTFGSGYVGADPTTVFADNAAHYDVLLPLCSADPPEQFSHLRLHNGTVWRWNRLLIGWDAARQPHLRLEQRVMPAGPTLVDMVANAAFYYGAVHMLAARPQPPEAALPFEDARANFYRAARDGLAAPQRWLDGKTHTAQALLTQLLPLAEEGLHRLGVSPADARRYLDVVALRLRTGQNGAVWQLAHHGRHGDLFQLTADYLALQHQGLPVHEWPV